MRWTSLLVLPALVLAVAAPLQAAEPDKITKVTEIEGISEYRLDNGLKVLLFPDASKPKVTVNLTIFVGSRHEGYGEAGMAHLLEHMLFKGTPDHPQIPKALQGRGAEFNGTTWVDRTNYYETLPASDENLEFAIRLEADRMVNSYVKKEDLTSEMTVVRNEFERGENSPAYVLSQRLLSAAYDWHGYGRSTIGNRADIERVPIENLRDFYKRYYQPDNAMLVVAGRFEPEKALEYIARYFGKLPKPERELPNTYTEEPAQDGERFVNLRRVGELPMAGAVYHIPSGAHPDYVAVDVLEQILTASPSGRLYKALVETRKASRVSGAAFAWHDPGVLQVMAEITKGNDPQVILDTMLDVIGTLEKEGVTEEEVERARSRLLKQRELSASDTGEIAVELSDWAAMGDWRLYFLYRDRLEKVTAEDVERVAGDYLQRNNRTVGIYLPTEQPERISVPPTPELAAMIGDYKGREGTAAGEAFSVEPKAINDRTQQVTLKSGVKAALLEKKTRGETVNLRLTLRYGNEANLQGQAKAAELLPTMLLRGTEKLTRQQLQDQLDKYRTQLNASGSAGEITFTLETKREHLADVLDLLRQVLREPTLPESEFAVLKAERISGLQRRLTDPDSLATTVVRQRINKYEKGDPRYVPSLEEEIEMTESVELADLKKLYEDYLGGQHGELAVVGDFSTEETLPVLNQMLDGWKAAQSYARLEKRAFDVKGSTEEIVTPDKANATYFAATTLPMSDTHADYPAMVMGDFILGGGSLSSRLGDRVRQQEGLAYGVGSGFQALAIDPRAAFYIYASTNPGNAQKLQSVIREELARILKDGVTDEELENAKVGYLQNLQVNRTDDASLAQLLTENLHADRTMEYYAGLEQKIEKLTPKQVHTALQKHIDPKQLVIVMAGDFRKDATKPAAAPANQK